MIKRFFSAIWLCCASACSLQGSIIPREWPKDFSITINHNGSMAGESMTANFTFDQCTYQTNSTKGGLSIKSFKLTDADRAEILKKMRELKADRIRSKQKPYMVYDGWQESICLGKHCVTVGSQMNTSKKHYERFSEVYTYLEEFAKARAK